MTQSHHGQGQRLWRHNWDGCESCDEPRRSESTAGRCVKLSFTGWVHTTAGFTCTAAACARSGAKVRFCFRMLLPFDIFPFLKSFLLLPGLSTKRSNTRTGKEEKPVPTTNLELCTPSITGEPNPEPLENLHVHEAFWKPPRAN